MKKNTYLLGIQPTGRLHIGHYIGVLKKAKELQDKGNIVIILIAQYHALTTSSGKDVFENRMNFEKNFRKMGFNEVQAQLSYILIDFWSIIAKENIGKLAHLPQYKSKEKTLGMLTYPVLMACDIEYSKCDYVIVGEDQIPHMEYYRYIAKKYKFSKIAKNCIIKDSKIMSIKDPTKKMSKSLGDEHCIYLDDTLEEIQKKIKKSPTDKAGLKNLINIAKHYDFDFDKNKCAESKLILAQNIFEKINKHVK